MHLPPLDPVRCCRRAERDVRRARRPRRLGAHQRHGVVRLAGLDSAPFHAGRGVRSPAGAPRPGARQQRRAPRRHRAPPINKGPRARGPPHQNRRPRVTSGRVLGMGEARRGERRAHPEAEIRLRRVSPPKREYVSGGSDSELLRGAAQGLELLFYSDLRLHGDAV